MGKILTDRREYILGIGGLASSLAGCGMAYNSRNYKVEFELTVDGKRCVGSVVQRLRTRTYSAIYGDTAETTALGEGAVIDLGPRGKLFSILRFPVFNRPDGQVKYDYSSRMLTEMGLADGAGHAATYFGMHKLQLDSAPGLVAFTNLNDAASVVAINPDDLTPYFGPNISLDRISVGFTWASVTKGEIEKSLPWLRGPQDERNLDGSLGQTSLLPYSLAREIVHSDFKREA